MIESEDSQLKHSIRHIVFIALSMIAAACSNQNKPPMQDQNGTGVQLNTDPAISEDDRKFNQRLNLFKAETDRRSADTAAQNQADNLLKDKQNNANNLELGKYQQDQETVRKRLETESADHRTDAENGFMKTILGPGPMGALGAYFQADARAQEAKARLEETKAANLLQNERARQQLELNAQLAENDKLRATAELIRANREVPVEDKAKALKEMRASTYRNWDTLTDRDGKQGTDDGDDQKLADMRAALVSFQGALNKDGSVDQTKLAAAAGPASALSDRAKEYLNNYADTASTRTEALRGAKPVNEKGEPIKVDTNVLVGRDLARVRATQDFTATAKGEGEVAIQMIDSTSPSDNAAFSAAQVAQGNANGKMIRAHSETNNIGSELFGETPPRPEMPQEKPQEKAPSKEASGAGSPANLLDFQAGTYAALDPATRKAKLDEDVAAGRIKPDERVQIENLIAQRQASSQATPSGNSSATVPGASSRAEAPGKPEGDPTRDATAAARDQPKPGEKPAEPKPAETTGIQAQAPAAGSAPAPNTNTSTGAGVQPATAGAGAGTNSTPSTATPFYFKGENGKVYQGVPVGWGRSLTREVTDSTELQTAQTQIAQRAQQAQQPEAPTTAAVPQDPSAEFRKNNRICVDQQTGKIIVTESAGPCPGGGSMVLAASTKNLLNDAIDRANAKTMASKDSVLQLLTNTNFTQDDKIKAINTWFDTRIKEFDRSVVSANSTTAQPGMEDAVAEAKASVLAFAQNAKDLIEAQRKEALDAFRAGKPVDAANVILRDNVISNNSITARVAVSSSSSRASAEGGATQLRFVPEAPQLGLIAQVNQGNCSAGNGFDLGSVPQNCNATDRGVQFASAARTPSGGGGSSPAVMELIKTGKCTTTSSGEVRCI